MTKDELLLEQEILRLELLRQELEEKKKIKREHRKLDPVVATILVALIGFLGSTGVSVYNAVREKDLKQREFETDLIKTALQQPTAEKREDLLRFINSMKLIKDIEVSTAVQGILNNPETIPSISVNSGIVFGTDPVEVDPEFKTSNEPTALLALKAAQKNIGASEDSIQNNTGKAISKFIRGGRNVPWSCSFVSWCFSQNPKGEPPFRFSYAWMELRKELIKKGMYSTDKLKIKKGDIYFLNYTPDSSPFISHGGIVEEVRGDSIIGIEGNTSNKVMRRVRNLNIVSGIGIINK